MNLNYILEKAEEITSSVNQILPPLEVLKECEKLSKNNTFLVKEILGYSKLNNPIDAYILDLSKKDTILVYGFPDPSEAIGGTTLLAIMKNLVNNGCLSSIKANWVFIPCLNFDDQPENGKMLSKVMKTSAQEVDWCLSNPRPETTALVNIVEQYKPCVVFPLHDEYHCEEQIPIYFPVSPKLGLELCNRLREIIKHFGLTLDSSIKDSKMGEGFFEMPDIANDYHNSTFSVMAKYGQVIEFELADYKNFSAKDLCKIQTSIITQCIQYLINN